jgi:hypothetical protein
MVGLERRPGSCRCHRSPRGPRTSCMRRCGWGPGPRVRQANLSIDIARRAWDIVARLHPDEVPNLNPFRGELRVHTRKIKPAASRAKAYPLIPCFRIASVNSTTSSSRQRLARSRPVNLPGQNGLL